MYSYIMQAANAVEIEKVSHVVIGRIGTFLADRYSQVSADAVFWVVCIAAVLATILIPYFLGSINFGIVVSKIFHKEDIREYGSGNAGTTNMLRTYGKRDAAITFLGDILKAVVSVLIGRILFGLTGGYAACFCCIVGHAFPCFYKFKGGKGVAVCAGAIAVIDWRIFLILLVIFVIIVAISRFISLGSMTAMLAFPLIVQAMDLGLRINPLISVMIAALVIYLHRENIKRIYKGKESKLSFSHTDKHKKETDLSVSRYLTESTENSKTLYCLL